MTQLSQLINKLPQFKEARMVANGFGLWVCWERDENPAVAQTLQDYGGLFLVDGRGQSLWFFFSTDIYLALARLEVWAKFNNLAVFLQVFPAKLLFSSKRELSLSLDGQISGQNAIVPDELEVWVHPKAMEEGKGLPGITFEPASTYTGLATLEWSLLRADSRLPYQSSLGCYGVIKPVGNPVDKAFQAGWREFWKQVEDIIQRLKLKFIVHEQFVLIQLEDLRAMRMWCKEFLQMVARLKEESPHQYWPCVQVIVDRKGLNFNTDLPKKIRLDWEQLVPDFPHLSYRNAYLLGEGFEVHDVRFHVDSSSVEDWCNVNLTADDSGDAGILPVVVSNRLVAGEHSHCFYCGLRTHEPQDCPTRRLEELTPRIWNRVAAMDFSGLNSGFQMIDSALAESMEEGIENVINRDGVDGTILKAVFSVNSPSQLRMMRKTWLARGKEMPSGLWESAPQDDNAVWGVIGMLLAGEHVQADKELQQVVIRNPRDFRSRSLNGFIAMERGDYARAQALWKEAETLSPSPLQQCYHLFLQARCLEVQGRYQQASDMYRQVMRFAPDWLEPLYRQAVCQVKMGFAEQAVSVVLSLIERDANMFNRVLLDPEMERGHLQLLVALNAPWIEAEGQVEKGQEKLEELRNEVLTWFHDEHPFAEQAAVRISKIVQMGEIKNYVSFMALLQGRAKLERDLEVRINRESQELKERFKHYMERLLYIRDEAAWFPFPRILVEFNKEYNLCAANLNWALTTHFQVADTFKRAQTLAENEEDRLEKLESRLKFLRIVRDATLYLLIMGKTFFWLELAFLLITLVALPLTLFYGEKAGAEWASDLLIKQKWQIQKGLILILSVAALGIAALRTVAVFDKTRDKLLKRDDE